MSMIDEIKSLAVKCGMSEIAKKHDVLVGQDEVLQEVLKKHGFEVAGEDCEIRNIPKNDFIYSESRGEIMMRGDGNDSVIYVHPYICGLKEEISYQVSNNEPLYYSPDCIVTPLKTL